MSAAAGGDDGKPANPTQKEDHEPFLEFYRLCEAGDTKEVKDKLEFELEAKFTWLNGRHPKTLVRVNVCGGARSFPVMVTVSSLRATHSPPPPRPPPPPPRPPPSGPPA